MVAANELAFDLWRCPDGTWGVMASSRNRERALGVDHHWFRKEAAEMALVVYRNHPEMHAHSTEAQVRAAYERLVRPAPCPRCGAATRERRDGLGAERVLVYAWCPRCDWTSEAEIEHPNV